MRADESMARGLFAPTVRDTNTDGGVRGDDGKRLAVAIVLPE